jgi:predicted transcriptional regulator
MTPPRHIDTPCQRCAGSGFRRVLNPTWLLHRRQALGMSQVDVARKAGIRQASVCSFETAAKFAGPAAEKKLVAVLGEAGA